MMRMMKILAACGLLAGLAGPVVATETTVPVFRPDLMPKPPIGRPGPQPTAPKPEPGGG